MKKTGVVRKLDDLGRIVIPKEIRNNFRIEEGDEIEFFVKENNIVLRKVSALENLETEIFKILQTYNGRYKNTIGINNANNVLIGYGKELNKLGEFLKGEVDTASFNENINRFFENKECYYISRLFEDKILVILEENPIGEKELEIIKFVRETVLRLLKSNSVELNRNLIS